MRTVVAGLLSVVLLAGCGAENATGARSSGTSSAESETSETTSATTAAAGIPEPAPVDEWIAAEDAETGIGFALPGTAKQENREGNADGTTPTIRQYGVEIHDGLSLGVSFTEAAAVEYSAEGLEFVADTLVDQFRAAGADDVETVDRTPSVIAGHPVLDFRLSFTAKNGKRTVWFIRFIGDGTRAIQFQTIAAVEPLDEDSASAVVAQYHQQLIGTLRLP